MPEMQVSVSVECPVLLFCPSGRHKGRPYCPYCGSLMGFVHRYYCFAFRCGCVPPSLTGSQTVFAPRVFQGTPRQLWRLYAVAAAEAGLVLVRLTDGDVCWRRAENDPMTMERCIVWEPPRRGEKPNASARHPGR